MQRVDAVRPSSLRQLLGTIREYRSVYGRDVEPTEDEGEDGPVILPSAVLYRDSQEKEKVV
jgi:hypothetical protein